MSCLAPCPACDRHISTDATACPFCAAAPLEQTQPGNDNGTSPARTEKN